MTLPDAMIFRDAGNGRESPCAGLYVGRLFVRATFATEVSTDHQTGAPMGAHRGWIVDHAELRVGVARVHTFDTALLIADELSRFAPDVHEVGSVDQLLAVVPAPLVEWMQYASMLDRLGQVPPCYRAWGGG
jgi:hypothetical protein